MLSKLWKISDLPHNFRFWDFGILGFSIVLHYLHGLEKATTMNIAQRQKNVQCPHERVEYQSGRNTPKVQTNKLKINGGGLDWKKLRRTNFN